MLHSDEGLVRERKETHRDGSNTKILDNRTIPIEVDPDPIPVEVCIFESIVTTDTIPMCSSIKLLSFYNFCLMLMVSFHSIPFT